MEAVQGLTKGLYQGERSGVETGTPGAVFNVAMGAMVRIYPTSAGTATVYSTGSNENYAATDVAAGDSAVTSSATAKWTQWSAGAVTDDTTLQAVMPQSCVAVVVTSGTWTLEVCQ